jgi:hypothetical protein
MLKPDTKAAWQFLQKQPALAGFVLTGGSALALLLAHRQSEDLDFAWPGAQLPRQRLAALRRASANAGLSFTPHGEIGRESVRTIPEVAVSAAFTTSRP